MEKQLATSLSICPQCSKHWPDAVAKCPDDNSALVKEQQFDPALEDSLSLSITVSFNQQSLEAKPVALSDAGPQAELPAGSVVGEYEILHMLGAGGGGTVYAAQHRSIGKKAAIKVIHPELARDPSAVQRFFTEAKTVNDIGHPALVDVFSIGNLPDGRPYLVMEWLSGEPLSARLRRRDLSMREKLLIVDQVAQALDAAHLKNVVHRDLKPDNIFLTVGPNRQLLVKLLDFGVAKLLDDGQVETTRTGLVVGTPLYMSPEQIRGKGVGPPSDVYSLGVVMYRLFTGRPPFIASNPSELYIAHLNRSPPSPDTLSPLVPVKLSPLMLQMLSKSPASRPSLTRIRAQVVATLDPNSKVARTLDRTGSAPATVSAPSGVTVTSSSTVRTANLDSPANPTLPVWLIAIGVAVVVGLAVLALRPRAHDMPAPPGQVEAVAPRVRPVDPPAPEVASVRPTRVAEVTIEVEPREADVTLDGTRMRLVGGRGTQVIEPAKTHELFVSAPGYMSSKSEVAAELGANTHVTIKLDPVPRDLRPARTVAPVVEPEPREAPAAKVARPRSAPATAATPAPEKPELRKPQADEALVNPFE